MYVTSTMFVIAGDVMWLIGAHVKFRSPNKYELYIPCSKLKYNILSFSFRDTTG